MLRNRAAPGALVVITALVACTGSADESTTTPAPPSTTTAEAAPESTTATDVEVMTSPTSPPVTLAQAELPLAPTPAQQEGPYYPVDRIDDQDSDLTVVDGLDGFASGETLFLTGTLLTTDGEPVADATIEIWQTDANGIYLHPGDSGLASRDPYFQGSGLATVAADGSWSFRTLNPGYYEPRPRHIHVKVHVGGQSVLTTQIYFSDDPQVDGIDEALVADIATTDEGLVATHRIVLDR